jgi:1,4-alpha-glucan branching enzyme
MINLTNKQLLDSIQGLQALTNLIDECQIGYKVARKCLDIVNAVNKEIDEHFNKHANELTLKHFEKVEDKTQQSGFKFNPKQENSEEEYQKEMKDLLEKQIELVNVFKFTENELQDVKLKATAVIVLEPFTIRK